MSRQQVDFTAVTTTPGQVRVGYAVTGAVLGALWWWGGDEPAWEHALRTAVFVVVVLPASYYAAQAIRVHRGRRPLPQISIARLIAAKLLLLAVALLAQALLAQVTDHAAELVAVGLFAVVAFAGPRCHHLLLHAGSR